MHNKKVTTQQAAQLMPIDGQLKKVLQCRAELLKTNETTTLSDVDRVSYISFKLGNNQLFGIPFSATTEVIRNVNITPIPFMPNYISGVINHRGLLLTVINLKKYFQIEDEINKDTSKEVIIIKSPTLLLGFQVDYIEGSHTYQSSLLDTISSHSNAMKSDYIIGLDKAKTTILNINPILSDIEQQLKNTMLRS